MLLLSNPALPVCSSGFLHLDLSQGKLDGVIRFIYLDFGKLTEDIQWFIQAE